MRVRVLWEQTWRDPVGEPKVSTESTPRSAAGLGHEGLFTRVQSAEWRWAGECGPSVAMASVGPLATEAQPTGGATWDAVIATFSR